MTMEQLERANVSLREYKQVKMMMALNVNIFEDEFKIHMQHDLEPHNVYNNFVDFHKLPHESKLTKQEKEILYRPERFAKLAKVYLRLIDAMKTDYLQRQHEDIMRRKDFHRQTKVADRIPKKTQEEYDLIDKICRTIDRELELSPNEVAAFKQQTTEAEIPLDNYTNHMDWYKPLLQRLIDERRKIPKEQRMRMKEDEIDAVNTTDLENWSFRGSFLTVEPKSED